MRRLLIILMSVALWTTGLGMNPAVAVDTTFSCGTGTYTVSDGVLAYGYCTADLVVLDSSVTSIGYGAMNGWRMKAITIPATVITIQNGAFYAVPNLETITVDVSNSHFKTVDGVLMNTLENRIIYYPGAKPGTTYNVPESVVTLDNRAFGCLTYLQVVNISETTTAIDLSSFSTCGYITPSLQEINVAETNTTYKSINHVLFSKDGTSLLNYPGNYAQPNYDIPEGTVTISGNAFSYTAIESVTFPSTLVTIQSYAFSYTSSLVSVGEFPSIYGYSGSASPFIGAIKVPSFSVASANNNFVSVEGVMFSKNQSILREYPGGETSTTYRIPDSVTEVDGQAFANTYLKTLTVPSTLLTIGYSYINLDYLVFEETSTISRISGFNYVEHIIYCGSTNAEITRFATSLGKSVECVESFFTTAPDAPTIGTATALSPTSASISFTAPTSNGGATIETYTATSNPGSFTGHLLQAGSGTITVTGLTASTAYTFTVTASNSAGTSSPSSASISITMPASDEELAAQAAQAAAAREAAARAASEAAAAKREAEKKSARSEISNKFKSSEKVTIETFKQAEIAGVTEDNIESLQNEILALSEESRSDITQVIKVARKYEVIAKVGTDLVKAVKSADLIEVGLIPEMTKHKASLTLTFKKLPVSLRSNYAAIKETLDAAMEKIQARKDRLEAVIARNAARNAG